MVRTKYATAVKLLMQEGQKAMNSRIETILLSQIKDRDDLVEGATEAEIDQIKVQYKKLPKTPDELYTRGQFLSPKIDEAELGHGGRDTLYMSFAAKATKRTNNINVQTYK